MRFFLLLLSALCVSGSINIGVNNAIMGNQRGMAGMRDGDDMNRGNRGGGMGGMGGRGGMDDDMMGKSGDLYLIENEMDFPPYNFRYVNEDGELEHKGFAIDLLKKAAHYGGCMIEFVAEPWRECMNSAQAEGKVLPTPWSLGDGLGMGVFDACSAASVSQSRTLTAGFSHYFAGGADWVIAVKPDLPNNRAPRSIFYINGWATSKLELTNRWPDLDGSVELMNWKGSAADAAKLVAAGGPGAAEALFVPIGNKGALDIWRRSEGPPIGLMTKKGSKLNYCINMGLEKMMKSGAYRELCHMWQMSENGGENLRCLGEDM